LNTAAARIRLPWTSTPQAGPLFFAKLLFSFSIQASIRRWIATELNARAPLSDGLKTDLYCPPLVCDLLWRIGWVLCARVW
jgi:hypothetical protein